MALRDDIAADVEEINAEMGEGASDTRGQFTWAGTAYPCGASTEARETVIGPNGDPVTSTLKLQVLTSSFPNSIPPRSGSRIIWNGRSYIVFETVDLHGAAAWLRCMDPGK